MRYILALALLVASSAYADSIERFKTFLNETRSARAQFEQKVYARDGALKQEANGTFVFLRPGRFRWNYAAPVEQLIVGDGERVWIYDKDLEQVTVRKLSKALGSTPAALLAGSADVEAAFQLRDLGRRDGLEWLEARPKDPDAGFEVIRMGFGAQDVQAMELRDNFGNTTVLRFRNVQRNPKVDPADFRFQPPKGADVLGEP